jgi:hypothetical protein
MALACLAAAAGCGGGDDDAPPVATPTLTLSAPRVPLGGLVDLTFRFVVAADAPAFGQDYRVLVHFLDVDEELMWTEDHNPPVPTSTWTPGQTIEYTRTAFFPIFPYLGRASIQLGLYSESSGERLPLAGDGAGQRAYRVASVELLPQDDSSFVVFRDGWHSPETAEGNPFVEWQWSRRDSILAVRNPRRDVLLYLHADQPGTIMTEPQKVTLTLGEETIDAFTVEPGEQVVRRVPLVAAQLGSDDTSLITLRVDPTFVPSVLAPDRTQDARELGIRVFHALALPRP